MLVVKIAWRNLFRHRGKSLVIGSILFLGAYLLTLGNAVITGMEKGLDRSVVEGFTGDILLVSDQQEDDNVVLGMMAKPVQEIYRFDTLRPRLESTGLFRNILPVGKNFAMAINEQGGTAGYAFLLGVNFKEWKQMFPHSIEVLHGQYPDSTGLLVSTGGLDQLYTTMGIWFWPRGIALDTSLLSEDARKAYPELTTQSDIVFMGFNESNTSSDIRRSLYGVSRFHALNKIWGHFLFVDIESYRRCMGLFATDQRSVPVNAEDQALLNANTQDLDALFGDPQAMQMQTDSTVHADSLSTTPQAAPQVEEAGAYNMVLTRLAPGIDRADGLDSLNRFLAAQNLPLRALTWQKASGPIGSMTVIIKVALNVFVFFLFLVAIIIIVNTLSMAAMERTTEIGMMRAVGAQKRFITSMFLSETGFLATVFGGSGIVAGIATVFIVQAQKITTDNDILQLFYGGDTFHPLFGMQDLALTIAQLVLVTVLASLYPVHVAQSITPLDAISRD